MCFFFLSFVKRSQFNKCIYSFGGGWCRKFVDVPYITFILIVEYPSKMSECIVYVYLNRRENLVLIGRFVGIDKKQEMHSTSLTTQKTIYSFVLCYSLLSHL